MVEIGAALDKNDSMFADVVSGAEVSWAATAGITTAGDYITDDWDDNSLSNSPNSRSGYSENTFLHPAANEGGDAIIGADRPNWNTLSGSPSASGGELNLPDGSTTVQVISVRSRFGIGTWQSDYQFQSNPSSGQAETTLFAASTSLHSSHMQNGYFIQIGSGGAYDLRNDDGGTDTEIINNTWSVDTNSHTQKATRDAFFNFELFLDGSSQGTAADNTNTFEEWLAIGNDTDVQINHDDYKVG